MVISGRHRLVGLAVGLGTGIAAAVLLAPKRRTGPSRAAVAADGALDFARGILDCTQAVLRNMRVGDRASGLMPDERLTIRVQSELERRGIWTTAINVTTIDGSVYVRGRETDPARAETVLRAVHEVPGVVEVIDELRTD